MSRNADDKPGAALNDVPDAKLTFVEFLDFECEGCNAERAARAVEAAAQQGKLEPMYHKMYETQSEWGEKGTPADDVFRCFAIELGLDMAAFDAAYSDPATAQHICVNQTTFATLSRMRSAISSLS